MTTPDNSGTHATLADSGDNTNSQELPRGSNLGRYVIIEPIGSGGMGTVYRAYDPQLNRGVALKILSVKHADLGTAERAKARLIREAQALAQLSHPNVVAVHDAGTFEDDVFIAMELIEGKTLDSWMKDEKRSIKEILKVMTAAGHGLSAAHKAGLVHRDFKPGNVIVGDDGRVRVLDFGLARAADQVEGNEEYAPMEPAPETADEQSQESKDSIDWREISSDSSSNLLQSPLTHAGGVLGTPMYMAPEQHLGLKTDERTDQFGFCVVLYEALYGKRPFVAKTLKEIKLAVIRRQICIPPSDTTVPTWLWQVIRKGLSRKPEDRHSTMGELLEDIGHDPEAQRAQKRKRYFLVLAFIFSAVLFLGAGYLLFNRSNALCTGANERKAATWNIQLKQSISKAFMDTGAPYAKDTVERVQKLFDKYTNEWARHYTQACEATHVKGDQSDEVLDLRMGCLRKRMGELEALLKVFAKADSGVVQKAVQASSSLVAIKSCADVKTLRASYPPPRTKEAKVKVAIIRKRLTEIEALQKTGKYHEGLELALKQEKKSNEVSYLPIQAEVLYWLGDLLDKVGEYMKAENKLNDAARAAGESGDALLAAEAMATLVYVVGYRQARPVEGLSIARYSEVMLFLAGGNNKLLSRLLNAMGVIYSMQDEYDQGLDHFRRSLKINMEILGKEHPQVADNLLNIGVVLWRKKEYDQALEYYKKALKIDEKSLGFRHPSVARDLNNLGLVFLKNRKYEKASKHLNRALDIWKNAFGKEHPLLAWPLAGLGDVYQAKGIYSEATEKFRRVVDICEKKNCEVEPYGRGLFGLARALVATGGDKERAIKLARQAKREFGRSPYLKEDIAEIDAWLDRAWP